ncbi:MAG: DUF2829 domain-containing protein [Oscillospiraceae bacterium]|nr:DUF2829 domain-containing protein [Oscillospiraceae bacterium]
MYIQEAITEAVSQGAAIRRDVGLSDPCWKYIKIIIPSPSRVCLMLISATGSKRARPWVPTREDLLADDWALAR